jgi:hypothetical protein
VLGAILVSVLRLAAEGQLLLEHMVVAAQVAEVELPRRPATAAAEAGKHLQE